MVDNEYFGGVCGVVNDIVNEEDGKEILVYLVEGEDGCYFIGEGNEGVCSQGVGSWVLGDLRGCFEFGCDGWNGMKED